MYTFNNVIGNQSIIKYLQNITIENKIPHAFIIDGPEGSGKKFISDIFVKTLECEEGVINPCLKCVSCKSFDNNNHIDVFFIRPEGKKSLGVEDIREKVNKVVNIKPYKYKYKIFVIEEADKMTVQAQNTILKTIEEPPEYAVFILLSNNYKVFLQTIISRCVLLKLKPIPIPLVKKYLIEEKKVSNNSADAASFFSEGNIGRAVEFLEDGSIIEMRNKIISFLIDFRNKTVIDIFSAVKILDEYKQNIKEVLDIMFLWFRDILVYKETKNNNFILNKENLNIIQQESMEYSIKSLYNHLDAINKAKVYLSYNSNFQLTMEVMLLNMKG